ncbi:MAG: GGDEF domain-containing protein [Wenzhouxiangellaceae bacterium]|nr:GGDEF domain-containing protein [Wenzhouxiangellaceae bacterium]
MSAKRQFMSASEFRKRFRNDYQFAMIMLFGTLAAVVVFGFVVYRYVAGYLFGGTVNLMIVVGMLLVLVYAIRSGETRRAGRFFVVVTVVACIASTAMFGRTGILWGYVVLWVNFLLTSRRFALVANLILTPILIIETDLFESTLEGLTYIITALLVTAFAWIFAHRLASYQDQLETLALQDPLTFAGNRRMMRRDLTAAVSASRRNGPGYTLMLLDLDHFKEINDRYGHEAGDEALRRFADLVRANIRAEDGFYRFGGEEFVLLLPGRDEDEAQALAERLHRRMSGAIECQGLRIRFSAGVAVLRGGEDWSDWLMRADRAMYRAKQAGRDRVEFVRADPAPRRESASTETDSPAGA